ncbi:hypothetical protein C0J52_09170 [Blattella germanica]|nr:hypothetical protein C0J52_09170 [Blattella germanica]
MNMANWMVANYTEEIKNNFTFGVKRIKSDLQAMKLGMLSSTAKIDGSSICFVLTNIPEEYLFVTYGNVYPPCFYLVHLVPFGCATTSSSDNEHHCLTKRGTIAPYTRNQKRENMMSRCNEESNYSNTTATSLGSFGTSQKKACY